jgi:hypothetical protein
MEIMRVSWFPNVNLTTPPGAVHWCVTDAAAGWSISAHRAVTTQKVYLNDLKPLGVFTLS